ncbi:MAG TPA: hypothetical protein VGN63_14075 [Flavisolibacter sp.]|nr:hypothetical protein [Flavisolibacter sp.]
MKLKRTAIAFLLLFCLLQPCKAQQPVPDSLLQASVLYQKGKRNTTVGGILLGAGLAGTLIGAMMSVKESTGGIRIGPSDKEIVFLLSGGIGLVGLIKLIQGGSHLKRACAEISGVSYWKAPGQSFWMPALTLRWPIRCATKTPETVPYLTPKCF